MKARVLLAKNIQAILNARKESQTDLANWCYKKPAWINKILNGTRPLHINDFDRVAEFLGCSVYHLFQPGVSAISERRHAGDRRSGRERRIGHVRQFAIPVDASATRGTHATATASTSAAKNAAIRVLVEEFEQKVHDVMLSETESGRQAPTAAADRSDVRPRHRKPGGPTAETKDGPVKKTGAA